MNQRAVLGIYGVVAVAACLVSTSCGSDDAHSGHSTTVAPSSTSILSQSSSTTSSGAAPTGTVAIGDVPGNPDAAAALRPWVSDLVGGDMDQLVRKCWTIEPANARQMYADKDGILAALAQPGLDGQFAVIWKGPVQTVSVKRSEIASGYACPRVAPTGSAASFNEADARYTATRFLSRAVGKPVHPDDTEANYRLACPGSILANNPGTLAGTTSFAAEQLTAKSTGPDTTEISVPVQNSSGATATVTFMLGVGPEGVCINDIRG